MKKIAFLLTVFAFTSLAIQAQTADNTQRALWASIAKDQSSGAVSLGDYKQHSGKVLISWRMLPGDNADTGFDLYRTIGTGAEKKIASNIKNRTCYQDGSASKTADNHYRLTYAGSAETLSSFTLTKAQNVNIPTAINNAATYRTSFNSSIYNLSGQRVDVSYKGILIKNGKKVYNK